MIDVAVCDDSALVRSLLREIIDARDGMRCVGVAADPYAARELIKATNPHVLTLDVEMPKMNGLDFLERLMRLRPMPVVMVSTMTERGSDAALRALELGAVEVVEKPKLGIRDGIAAISEHLVGAIHAAAQARVMRLVTRPAPERLDADAILPRTDRLVRSTEKIVALGASTGGTEAVSQIVTALPPDAPAVLVVQHMPPLFTRTFALRLDANSRVVVKEAEDAERALPGHVYIAPGDRHLVLDRRGSDYLIRLSDGPPVARHRPSVDVLFRSVANVAGPSAVAAILTGMGDDGAEGLRELREAGAVTIAQDEATCVVFGMPKAAIALGGAHRVLPLGRIAGALIAAADAMGSRVRV